MTDTVHVEALTELGPVSWRVRGRSEQAPGPWSEIRTLDVIGTMASASGEYDFLFSTAGLAVGKDLLLTSSSLFAAPLTAAIQASGATLTDLRDILADAFYIAVNSPAGTTLDDFSNWALLLSTGSEDATIMTIDEPAPTLESGEVSFSRPQNWTALATDPDTRIVLSIQMNPRSPRTAEVHVSARLDMTAVLNYSR